VDKIDPSRKEQYLPDAEFQQVFGMNKADFEKQPAWKKDQAKKKNNLF